MATTTTCTINAAGTQATIASTLDAGTWGTITSPTAGDLTVHVDQNSGTEQEYYDANPGSAIDSVTGGGTATATIVVDLTRLVPKQNGNPNWINSSQEIYACEFSIPANWITDGTNNSDAETDTAATNNSTAAVAIAQFTRPSVRELIADDFRLGVAAKCDGGIASVQFYDDSDDTLLGTATSRAKNTEAGGYYDWGITVDVSDFSDGDTTIRAVVNPSDSDKAPRTIRWRFTANSGGSHTNTGRIIYVDSVNGNDANDGTTGSPYATLSGAINGAWSDFGDSGGITYRLRDGSYRFNTVRSDNTEAVIIEADDGHTPDIDQFSNTTFRWQIENAIIRCENITIDLFSTTPNTEAIMFFRSGTQTVAFYDSPNLRGDFHNQKNSVNVWTINCNRTVPSADREAGITDEMHGGRAINCVLDGIKDDAFSRMALVLNCESVNSTFVSGAHPDGYQTVHSDDRYRTTYNENCIVDGLYIEGECQGLFVSDGYVDSVWFENLIIDYELDAGSIQKSQWVADNANNVHIRHCYFNQEFSFNGTGAHSSTNCSIKYNVFDGGCEFAGGAVEATTEAAIDIDVNHFATGSDATPGTNTTTGDPNFVTGQTGAFQFRPDTGSDLLSRYSPGLGEYDYFGIQAPATNAAIGASQGVPPEPEAGTPAGNITGAYLNAGAQNLFIVFDGTVAYSGGSPYPVTVTNGSGSTELTTGITLTTTNILNDTINVSFSGDIPAAGDSTWTVTIVNSAGKLTGANGVPIADVSDLVVTVLSAATSGGRSRDRSRER